MTFLNVHFLLAVFRKVMRGPPEMSRLSLSLSSFFQLPHTHRALSLSFSLELRHTEPELPLFLSRATPHRAVSFSRLSSNYPTHTELSLSLSFSLELCHTETLYLSPKKLHTQSSVSLSLSALHTHNSHRLCLQELSLSTLRGVLQGPS